MRGILWVIWIVLVVLLGWGVFQYKAPAIQNDILSRTTQSVKEANPDVGIAVDGRLVTLEGTVSSQQEKDKILATVARVSGALGPNDKIQVAAPTAADQPASTPAASTQASDDTAAATTEQAPTGQGSNSQQVQPDSAQPATSESEVTKPDETTDALANGQQPNDKATTTPSQPAPTEKSVPTDKDANKACDQSIAQVMQGKIIRFDSSSSNISPESAELISDIAKAAKTCSGTGLRINISGYADSSGNNVHNQELSQRRAEAVKSALVSQGLSAEWISTKGFGDAQPVSSNDTVEGRAQNRRVTLDLTIH